MALVPSDLEKFGSSPSIWSQFTQLIHLHEGSWAKLTECERFSFYERAKKGVVSNVFFPRRLKNLLLSEAFAVVATSETALYANLILKKGTVPPKS